MALGADRMRVLKMVLYSAFSQIGIGIAIGIPAAIGAGKLMTNQLFGVNPWSPTMFETLAALMLALAALLASAIPARGAAGVEPMVALRNE
jgi:ABC-type antimicrobial peptide transport system permease subunit